MKKSLITLAVASGLMVSGAAAAESKVYGHAQAEVGSWSGDTADGMSVEDRARGRFGVKASEDLGGGMKGIAKFEWKVDTADGVASDSSDASLTKREMLVGLQTGMGQIELGRLKSAYKYYGGVAYDPYVASMLEARGNGGMTGGTFGHNAFIDDSFGYEHKVGAMEFRLTYDLDDDGGPGMTGDGANALTFGFKFGTRDYEFIVALVDEDEDTAGGGSSESGVKVGGQVKLGGAGKLSLQLEQREDETAAATMDTDVIYLDYQFPIDKNNIVDVAWGNTDADGGSETDFMRLAVTHKFSKQTKTWIGYRATETDNAAGVTTRDESVVAVGLQKRF